MTDGKDFRVCCTKLTNTSFCVDCMPSGNTDLVLLDTAAQWIDPSCLESHDSSPMGSNKLNAVLVC